MTRDQLAQMIETRIGQDSPDTCCLAAHEAREIIAALRAKAKPSAPKKVRYARARGATLQIQRSNVPDSLHDEGDVILAWVNEGDIGMAGKEVA